MENQPEEEKYPSRERIERFKLDATVMCHIHSQTLIAKRMEIEDSNLRLYRNETHKITEDILGSFYKACGEELKAIYEKRVSAYATGSIPESVVEEKSQGYDDNYKGALIDTLQKNNNGLLDNLGKVISTNQDLASSNGKLAETTKNLVEFHLSMSNKGQDPDNQSSPT